MGSNDLLGKHCSLLSCSLTCRSGRSRPAETGRHLNSLWHEGGLSSYLPSGQFAEPPARYPLIPTARIPDVSSRPEPRGARRGWSVVGRRHGRARMTIAITRREPGAGELRREAARCRDAAASRRMLALALVLEGSSRAEAARAAGMDRQTLRDWVHRYNAEGLPGLRDRPRSGRRPRLSPGQEAELATAVERGPDPDRDGAVRWRRVDLKALIEARFGARLHERTVGKVPRRLGFTRPSVRPKHPKADEAAQAAFKEASPIWYARRYPSAP